MKQEASFFFAFLIDSFIDKSSDVKVIYVFRVTEMASKLFNELITDFIIEISINRFMYKCIDYSQMLFIFMGNKERNSK